jgi:hypothetical protein
LFEVLRNSIGMARKPASEERVLGHAGASATVGLMVAGLFEFNLGDSEVLMLYLFLISATFAWTRLEQKALPLSPE